MIQGAGARAGVGAGAGGGTPTPARAPVPSSRLLTAASILVAVISSSRPATAQPAWHLLLISRTPGAQIARLATPQTTLPALGEGEVTLEAGGEITHENGPIVATGGVTLTQGVARLTAQKVTADQDTGEVVAEGSVVFTEPGRTVRGERIDYNINTRQVRASAAVTVVKGVIVRARTIAADPARYTVTDATITTCDLPRPHYQLTARSVVLTPNDRIVARHVGIWLLGLRLLVVPRVEARIGAARGETGGSTPFPRVGSNSRDGFFVQKVLPLIDSSRLYLDFDARLTVRRGLIGGFDAAAPVGSRFQFIGALKYRDEAPNQRTTFLEVDRLPEVGVLWISPPSAPRPPRRRSPRSRRGRETAHPAAPVGAAATAPAEPGFRPLSEVGSDVEHQPGLLRPPEPGRWYIRAQTTVGYFHQREGDAFTGQVLGLSHARLDLRATASRAGLRVGGLSLPVLQLFFRQSLYDDDHAFNVLGVAAREDWHLGPHWSSGLQAFLHKTSGQTPFQFDRVEIRTELQPALSYRLGGTTLSWLGRIDIDRGQLFDQELGIARVLHCLEPRLSYHTRRRQINLEVRIVGLDFE